MTISYYVSKGSAVICHVFVGGAECILIITAHHHGETMGVDSFGCPGVDMIPQSEVRRFPMVCVHWAACSQELHRFGSD